MRNLVDQLARLLDPPAWAPEPRNANLGQLFARVTRQVESRDAAQRAIDAGWRPTRKDTQ